MANWKGFISQLNKFYSVFWHHHSATEMRFLVKQSLHPTLHSIQYIRDHHLVLYIDLSLSCCWIIKLVCNTNYMLWISQQNHATTFIRYSIISRHLMRLWHIMQIGTNIIHYYLRVSIYTSVVQTQLYLKGFFCKLALKWLGLY